SAQPSLQQRPGRERNRIRRVLALGQRLCRDDGSPPGARSLWEQEREPSNRSAWKSPAHPPNPRRMAPEDGPGGWPRRMAPEDRPGGRLAIGGAGVRPPPPHNPSGGIGPGAPQGSSLRMLRPLRARFERGGILQGDLAKPLGLELLLRQRHAALEHLRVALDASALEIKPTDAVEGHACAAGLGSLGCEAEAITGVTGVAAERGGEELPAEVAAAIGKVRKHLLDGFVAGAGPEK